MIQIQEDLNNKLNDASEFYLFIINSIESPTPTARIDPILKSMFILMLYNIIESTITSLIVKIHDELQQYPLCSFKENLVEDFLHHYYGDNLKDQKKYKRKVLTTIKKYQKNELFFPSFNNYYKNNSLFSGNVDGKKIREVFAKYNIKDIQCKEKIILIKIKEQRNILSHGEKTFKHVGRELIPKNLEEMLNSVKLSMNEAINNVNNYLSEKKFLY